MRGDLLITVMCLPSFLLPRLFTGDDMARDDCFVKEFSLARFGDNPSEMRRSVFRAMLAARFSIYGLESVSESAPSSVDGLESLSVTCETCSLPSLPVT